MESAYPVLVCEELPWASQLEMKHKQIDTHMTKSQNEKKGIWQMDMSISNTFGNCLTNWRRKDIFWNKPDFVNKKLQKWGVGGSVANFTTPIQSLLLQGTPHILGIHCHMITNQKNWKHLHMHENMYTQKSCENAAIPIFQNIVFPGKSNRFLARQVSAPFIERGDGYLLIHL